jgi:hypothetical protein
MQTKKQSLIESLTNILIGYTLAVISQLLIFPFFDIVVTLSETIEIALYFTVISIIRSYLIRRYFNSKDK